MLNGLVEDFKIFNSGNSGFGMGGASAYMDSMHEEEDPQADQAMMYGSGKQKKGLFNLFKQ